MSLLTLLKPKGPTGGGGTPPPIGTFVADNCPYLIVEIDFVNDPTVVNRTFTDVTSYVRDIAYQRDGRQHELQRTETGTLTAILSNRDGRFDPTFTGTGDDGFGDVPFGDGPFGGIGTGYWPNVKRTRWMRVSAVWDGVIYTRWQGLIENYDGEWPAMGMDATVTITASTPTKILNLFDLNGLTFEEATSGIRVLDVLAATGLPASAADLGISTLPAITFTSPTSALSHLQQVEETENGLLYANEGGWFVFEDRHHRLLDTAATIGIIGDGSGAGAGTYGDGDYGDGPYGEAADLEIPYGPVRFEYDDANIWNHALVTPAPVPDQEIPDPPGEASDATSIAEHYERTINRSLLVQDYTEAQSAAEYLVAIYKEPSPRISTVEMIGRAAPTTWPLILAAGNSDQFLWRRRPSTEASPRTIELPVYVERVAEQITPGARWATTFQLSPADSTFGWILDVSTLGVDTALTY